MSQLKILCFDFCASGLRFCETSAQAEADKARKGIKGLFKSKCAAPDFFTSITSAIFENKPNVVVFATQEEASRGTYFHSDFLTGRMPEIGYSLLKKETLRGVGEISSGNRTLADGVSDSALRTSIYVMTTEMPDFQVAEAKLDDDFGNQGQQTIVCKDKQRRSGAIGSYVTHRTFGKFLFLNTQLTDGSGILTVQPQNYPAYREPIKASNRKCLENIVSHFITAIGQYSPDHVILMGELNSKIVVPGKNPLEVANMLKDNLGNIKKFYMDYDELAKNLKDPSFPLMKFREGINGDGINFIPTWKLLPRRSPDCATLKGVEINLCYNIGSQLSDLAWGDRVLYAEYGRLSNYKLECTKYERVDVGNIKLSQHAAVWALFTTAGR